MGSTVIGHQLTRSTGRTSSNTKLSNDENRQLRAWRVRGQAIAYCRCRRSARGLWVRLTLRQSILTALAHELLRARQAKYVGRGLLAKTWFVLATRNVRGRTEQQGSSP